MPSFRLWDVSSRCFSSSPMIAHSLGKFSQRPSRGQIGKWDPERWTNLPKVIQPVKCLRRKQLAASSHLVFFRKHQRCEFRRHRLAVQLVEPPAGPRVSSTLNLGTQPGKNHPGCLRCLALVQAWHLVSSWKGLWDATSLRSNKSFPLQSFFLIN